MVYRPKIIHAVALRVKSLSVSEPTGLETCALANMRGRRKRETLGWLQLMERSVAILFSVIVSPIIKIDEYGLQERWRTLQRGFLYTEM